MADISKITLPSGTTYDLKDAYAREAIAAVKTLSCYKCTSAENTPQGVTWTNGQTTITGTLVASASTENKIYLVPSSNGTKDIYDEYFTVVTDNNTYSWELFGNTDVHLSDLGALAKKDSASGSVTPTGTVSAPTFTGDELTSTGSVTAAGSVSAPSFTGSAGSVSVTGTPGGAISTGSGTPNYTPAGTVSQPTTTVELNDTTKYVAGSATGGGSVTPGSAASCTLPTLEATVTGETLSLAWTAGSFSANTPTAVTLPTFSSQKIATGVKSAVTTQPTFAGTGAELKFTGSQMTSTGSFTPAGTVGTPTFTGEAVSVSVSGTPTGTVSQPTFTGNAATVTVS